MNGLNLLRKKFKLYFQLLLHLKVYLPGNIQKTKTLKQLKYYALKAFNWKNYLIYLTYL